MSERESAFTRLWSTILSGFLLALMLGAFAFHGHTNTINAQQDIKIHQNTKDIESNKSDIKDQLNQMNSKIDKLIDLQLNKRR